ncbi:hypothetical protein [Saccharopolyspora tripterygii]
MSRSSARFFFPFSTSDRYAAATPVCLAALADLRDLLLTATAT